MSNDENHEDLKGVESDLPDKNAGFPNIITNKEGEQEIGQSILVEWDGDDDALDPRTFSAARKWFYVAVVSTGSLLV